ncbi:efflux RND transporter periplasmic adaptor subunit [Motiliproteus sp. SC1-56]|uniref:efflux RND transporter periplasmic adaptor subunit n=1 Tax=Motiliproteus sp. SC1-56 TaxID=2799565 RepID=UPI001A8DCCA2|nr:efflux RND transporter periplasmic adaptor subunit [Motiliproteus sp. SC1-56]
MRWSRGLLPLLVLALCAGGAYWLLQNPPEAKRGRAAPAAAMTVEGTRLRAEEFQVVLDSYGVVRPRTQGPLVAQVSGQVVAISEQLREGAFFEAGDELLRIDDRDYRAQVAVAEAELVQAELRLKEERARAEQARRDWQRLGQGEAGELVLRKPQLAAAEAAIASARARLTRARLDLERTRITAPYAGRVLSKAVGLGQVVSAGNTLAEIYAVDYVEVRLPLNNRQLEFIRLPERYRGGEVTSRALPPVTLEAQVGSDTYLWQGRVVRVEGAIDAQSRQLFVVAQVDDPYRLDPQGKPPLKVGQFVKARIQGERLKDVFVLPRETLTQDNQVMLIEGGRLRSRQVIPRWTDNDHVVISSGLEAGEVLNLTPVGAMAAGTRVEATVDGAPVVQKGDGGTPADARVKSAPAAGGDRS